MLLLSFSLSASLSLIRFIHSPCPTFPNAMPPPPPAHYVTGHHHHHHSLCSVVWRAWSCSSIDNSPAVAEPKASSGGYFRLSIYITFLHSAKQDPQGHQARGRPAATARLSHNMYPDPLWMIMTQRGFAESRVFRIRRSMLLQNQADTEQMLTWSTVFIWKKRNLLFFPSDAAQHHWAKLCAISPCFHAGCPADRLHYWSW